MRSNQPLDVVQLAERWLPQFGSTGKMVQVFNRWGNLVFEQKGYTNADAWNGQWNGKDLPDGTYFYLIELGGNAAGINGWLQILR